VHLLRRRPRKLGLISMQIEGHGQRNHCRPHERALDCMESHLRPVSRPARCKRAHTQEAATTVSTGRDGKIATPERTWRTAATAAAAALAVAAVAVAAARGAAHARPWACSAWRSTRRPPPAPQRAPLHAQSGHVAMSVGSQQARELGVDTRRELRAAQARERRKNRA
jgi:hypothetical protein